MNFTSIETKNKTENKKAGGSNSFEMSLKWCLHGNSLWRDIKSEDLLLGLLSSKQEPSKVLRENSTFNEPLRSYLCSSSKETMPYGAYVNFVIMNCFSLFVNFVQWDWGGSLGFINDTEGHRKILSKNL